MKLKDLSKIERPRERLIRYGVGKLSDIELLATILGTGKKGENVLQLAERIFKKYNKDGLTQLNFGELKNNFRLGEVKACQLLAVIELGKRLFKTKSTGCILTPKDIWQELRDIRENKKEHFIIFYLDVNNLIIKKEIISIGTLNTSLVHPREVFEPAVKYLAAQIILVHNHPSGVCRPSTEDIEITKQLIGAGKIMGIEVVDHVIVTKEEYFSFKEKKLI